MTFQHNCLPGRNYIMFQEGAFHEGVRKLPEEALALIQVNDSEVATLMCSPYQLEELAFGFLRAEAMIRDISDVEAVSILPISAQEIRIDVRLKDGLYGLRSRRIITSGLGGGMIFDQSMRRSDPLPLQESIDPFNVLGLVEQLVCSATLYREASGIHSAALSDGERLLMVAEDIARHNTLHRIWGRSLMQGVDTRGKILVCTGRISSEMVTRVASMQIPIVISFSSPTSLAVALADMWNVTLIGYARGRGYHIYSVPERIANCSRPVCLINGSGMITGE